MLIIVGRVIVLLLMLTGSGVVRARDVNETDLRIFEFTSVVFTHVGRCQLKGLMSFDGARQRMAVYWTEPGRVRDDNTFFVSACDVLFTEKAVHYWIHGVAEPGILRWSDRASAPLLARQSDVQSVLRSALAIVNYLHCKPEPERFPQHLHCFLRDSRFHPEYTYEYTPDETDKSDLFDNTVTDRQILSALPLGRQYVKKTLDDGTLQWRFKKTLNNEPVIRVTVKRRAHLQEAASSSPFDADTLGQWSLIPEAYRFYWSCRAACLELSSCTSPNPQGSTLCHRIKSYLEARQVPDQVCRALERLWFDTALVTGDIGCVRQSLQATVTGFCQDDSVSNLQALVELGRIVEKLESHCPKLPQTTLKPVIEQVVKHAGEGIVESFSQLIRTIDANNWSSFGDLLLEAIRCQGLVENTTVDALATSYQATRLVREKKPFDRSKSCATVKQYLDLLNDDPPPGALTMGDVRYVLKKGLTRHYPGSESKAMGGLVENVVKSLRLIAGEGPFRGNQAELTKSIERFSRTYFDVCQTKKPIDMALATFLALSFYDISTPQDHDVLCGQISQLSYCFQSQVNTMLRAHAIHSLLSPDDVEGIFHRYYEEQFRGYVGDPLCPAFKFPLTANEEVRLTNKLILRFLQLEPLFEEMSLKVKYGGGSVKLKDKTVSGVSRATRYLLPSMAFLRQPSYPGVACHYRGEHGFAAVIPARLYQADCRPKERFQAMQYFHLGHRIEEIMKRERAFVEREYQGGEKQ